MSEYIDTMEDLEKARRRASETKRRANDPNWIEHGRLFEDLHLMLGRRGLKLESICRLTEHSISFSFARGRKSFSLFARMRHGCPIALRDGELAVDAIASLDAWLEERSGRAKPATEP